MMRNTRTGAPAAPTTKLTAPPVRSDTERIVQLKPSTEQASVRGGLVADKYRRRFVRFLNPRPDRTCANHLQEPAEDGLLYCPNCESLSYRRVGNVAYFPFGTHTHFYLLDQEGGEDE